MADDEEEVVPKTPMLIANVGAFAGAALAKAFATAETDEPWEVIGTLKAGTVKPKVVSRVVEATGDALKAAIAAAKVIVLDLVGDANGAEQLLGVMAGETYEEEKVVVAVSTIMTWARTSPADEEDPEKALTEEEYKRRRPHVNFRDQHTLEKLVVRSKTEFVRTHVVCAGLLYGGAEDLFHDQFRAAWHGEALSLLSLKDGSNVVPTVHIADLCSVVQKVADAEAPSYILAIDQGAAEGQTLAHITNALAKVVGTGDVVTPPKEEVLLDKNVDYFQVNLHIEPTTVLEMGFDWVGQPGMAKRMAKVAAEYRKERGIQPLKLLVVGVLAGVNGCLEHATCEAIAKEYKVPHITAASLVAEALEEESELADRVRAAKAADKQNTGILSDDLMAELLRRKLNSTACTNQGWVLDGYPQTLPQLRLMAPEKEDEEEEEEEEGEGEEGEEVTKPPADLTPEHVLVVRAPNDDLKARVQALTQTQVEASGMTQDQLSKRTQAFAQANQPEGPNNMLMHKALRDTEALEVDADGTPVDAILARARIYLGKPRNYGPTEAEVKAREERAAALKAEEEAEAKAKADECLAEEKAEQDRLRKDEQARVAELERQEKELLEARSVPLRAYLMAEVIPTLTEGLIEVTKVRPEDPVDYLAEWLFKNNPVID